MTRLKLLFVTAAVLMATVAVRPAKSDACFAYGICRSCTPTTSQPCFVVQCPPKPATYNCGSCTTNCVPPDI